MIATDNTTPFALRRLGVIMTPDPDDPHEAWGVLNPGGACCPVANGAFGQLSALGAPNRA